MHQCIKKYSVCRDDNFHIDESRFPSRFGPGVDVVGSYYEPGLYLWDLLLDYLELLFTESDGGCKEPDDLIKLVYAW